MKKKVPIIIVIVLIIICFILMINLSEKHNEASTNNNDTTKISSNEVNTNTNKTNKSDKTSSKEINITSTSKTTEIKTTETSKTEVTKNQNTTSEKTSTTKANNKDTTTTKTSTTTKKTTTTKKSTTTTTTSTTKKSTTTTTTKVTDEVDELRRKLESTYGIKIKYGNEIGSYRPKNLKPTIMDDKDDIKKYLQLMETELKKYPSGFFKEFDGMPLTIFLINSIQNNSFVGFTDKEFMYDIKITLVKDFQFQYTLNHEIMHYIDAYLEIKMYPNTPYTEYEALNPPGYHYGSNIDSYNYGYNGLTKGAYFLGNYAQTNVREDRAEVFKQMITRVYRPVGMFDEGETLRKKALVIDKQIRENFKSAKGTLFWDKYIK